jgi:signal peptidase II
MLKKMFSSGLRWLWIAIIIVVIDRYSKIWMMDHLDFLDSLEMFPFFNLTLAFNKGVAFSFLHSASGWQQKVLSLFACSVSAWILYWLYKENAKERWLNVALCLIVGGALGNIWDRMQYGFVIDFLDFHLGEWHFAIFNVADSAVCVGSFMLLWHWIRSSSYK